MGITMISVSWTIAATEMVVLMLRLSGKRIPAMYKYFRKIFEKKWRKEFRNIVFELYYFCSILKIAS